MEVRVVTGCFPDEEGVWISTINVQKLIQGVVISPLLPRDEAKAIEGQIRNHGCWNGEIPMIRRSSILGQIVDEDETTAHLRDFRPSIRSKTESGLPPLLSAL